MKITTLKKLRLEQCYTQKVFAGKVNIPLRSYQNYETGERLPNVHIAIRMAQALNTSVEKLFPTDNTTYLVKKQDL